MVRIAGIDLPRTKRLEYALTKIFGIGVISANEILTKANIDPNIVLISLILEKISKSEPLPHPISNKSPFSDSFHFVLNMLSSWKQWAGAE